VASAGTHCNIFLFYYNILNHCIVRILGTVFRWNCCIEMVIKEKGCVSVEWIGVLR
jgi:hypothetical protein